MRRFLIVDDDIELSFDEELSSDNEIDGIPADVVHLNPNDYILGGGDSEIFVKNLLADVGRLSGEFWDVVAIDLNLGDFGFEDKHRNSEVCLRVAEAVRDNNRAATLFLYSGTLAKFISDILNDGASDTQLRRIFHAEVQNFVQRNRIAPQVTAAVDEPSWILRVDRSFMKLSHLKVTPEEAEFSGRTFEDLAAAVRRQDKDGQRLVELVSEYGISAFADLNS
jgi:hypothetical protein